MEKLNDIIGKPIMTTATAKEIGKVKDAVLDDSGKQLLAFVVKEPKLGGQVTVLPFAAVRSLGPGAVMVENEQAVIPAKDDPAIEAALASGALKDSAMVSEDGRTIGVVGDLLIDPSSGAVKWYEASQGAVKDATKGPLVTPAEDVTSVSQEGVVLDAATLPQPESTVIPEQPVAQRLAEKAKDLTETAKEKMAQIKQK